MNIQEIEQKRDAIIEEHGEWTGHNIHLRDDVYTYKANHPQFNERRGHEVHLRRIVRIVADIIKKPLNECRVLDLACLEGLYALEFAKRGAAEVVGIEGRASGVVKSQFAADALELTNVKFAQDDVRNLSVEKYGEFDVVLCLGIFYHIDAPDVFYFMERMREVCKSLLIIDTHVAVKTNRSHKYRETEFYGVTFAEHNPNATAEERLKGTWASLDNDNSFWFTRPSLHNLLVMNGFTSVFTCNAPVVDDWSDRDTIVAIKGEQLDGFSGSDAAEIKLANEINERGVYPTQRPPDTFIKRIARKLGAAK